jgi:acetyl-CoA carboxylase carboxyltransferase component
MTGNGAGSEADWGPWLERLAAARAASTEMGGADRLDRHVYAKQRLDVRRRIDVLLDPGSFTEIGGLVGGRDGLPADGFVCGFGEIDGRPVAVGAEDFSIKAGSIGTGGHYKRHRIAELAVQEGAPVVWLIEGAGARLGPRTSEPPRLPSDLEPMADAKGRVPVVCAVLGVSAGHGAITAPLSDFVVMTESAAIFTGGPDLVKAATGESVTVEDLGGWRVAVQAAGTVHNVVADDAAALAMIRDYLGYFPSNRSQPPPVSVGPDTGPRATPELLGIIPPDPRRPYDVRLVIRALVDDHSFFEVQPRYGSSITVGWGRLGGRPVGIVANNPRHQAGALTSAAAIKATELIELADTFGQPVIFLVDNPGVMAGTAAERAGILKWGGRMYLAGRRLRSPKISVLMRKGFGFGLVTMAHMPHDRQTMTLSLPSANIAAMPAQSGGRTANLDDETLSRLEQAQRGGPYGLADRLGVDDVVEPGELRNVILRALAFSSARPRITE